MTATDTPPTIGQPACPPTTGPAPEVRAIANDLIEDHHHDLAAEQIRYVFREPAAKSKGRTVYGKARKISGLNAYLAAGFADDEIPPADRDDTFLVVEIAEKEWVELTTAQRRALVDHELCHFSLDEDNNGNVTVNVIGHDLEEFRAVVQRHGLWRPEVRAFTDVAVKQWRLRILEGEGDVEGSDPDVEPDPENDDLAALADGEA